MTTITYTPNATQQTEPETAETSAPLASKFDPARHQFPSFAAVVVTRAVLDLKAFFRDRHNMIWIFAFPVIMLALFSLIWGTDAIADPNDTALSFHFAQIFLPGMLAQGVVLSSFTNLAGRLALDRERGALKRLRATPVSPAAMFIAKIATVLLITVIQTAILLAVGVLVFSVTLPNDSTSWFNLAWILLLGVAAGSACGIAFSSLPRTASATANVASGIPTLLAFISGVFIVGNMPDWLLRIAQVFPLYWLASGLRVVFLTEARYEDFTPGSWPAPNLGQGALVMAAWLVVGLLVAVRTFRWQPKDK